MRTPRILATPWTMTSWQTTSTSVARSVGTKARKASRNGTRAGGAFSMSFSIVGFSNASASGTGKPTRTRRSGAKKSGTTKRRKRAA
ncbi:MAG: hypothetical protein IBJ18_01415 [Phycisphaerales bacterium]|nr:hypothetical protein [Phycisphaerales bacterium]